MTGEEARRTLAHRLAHREDDFLAILRRLVYDHPRSPYQPLLRRAHCEYRDVERLVRHDGLEHALARLFQEGVYLTVDEFKGRRPVVRGRDTLPFDPVALANPDSVVHVFGHSSGSRGPRTAVPFDLASVRAHAIDRRLSLEARGALAWRHARWAPPGGQELVMVLRFAVCGAPPLHWFSPVDPADPGVHARYRWSDRVVRGASRLAGLPLPSPRYVPVDAPYPILEWMTGTLRAGHTPHLAGYTSPITRLCHVARSAGIDIRGAQFTVTGEPLTETRRDVIHAAGAEVANDYGSTESGQIAEWCLAPETPDDMHFFQDVHALIQAGAGGVPASLPDQALLLSSLRPTAPLILLNVSLGDQASVTDRTCGCPMERLGWTTHISRVRSFEKLTGAGMTFLDVDAIQVLDEVLPRRFGGGPGHFQLVESEAPDGRARLTLVVHPDVGPAEPAALADALLDGLGSQSDTARLMTLAWRGEGLLQVERRAPRTQPSGKILHLVLDTTHRGDAAARASRSTPSPLA